MVTAWRAATVQGVAGRTVAVVVAGEVVVQMVAVVASKFLDAQVDLVATAVEALEESMAAVDTAVVAEVCLAAQTVESRAVLLPLVFRQSLSRGRPIQAHPHHP